MHPIRSSGSGPGRVGDDRPVADLDAKYFDGWYGDMSQSPTQQRIQQEALGLPARLQSSSLLTWAGLAEVIDLLGVGPGDTLLDVACGRGGYGLEAAARTGAQLIGVDFSAVAIAQADRNATHFELAQPPRFVVGDLTATGLPDHSVDAVMCVDAIQFAAPFLAAASEFRRVVRPGGRIVAHLLAAGRPRGRRSFPRGCAIWTRNRTWPAPASPTSSIIDRPDWHEAERVMWDAADRARTIRRPSHPEHAVRGQTRTRPVRSHAPGPDHRQSPGQNRIGCIGVRQANLPAPDSVWTGGGSHRVGRGSRLFEPAAMTV